MFFCDKVYTECDFLPGTTKQSSSNYWDRNLFFAGRLTRNAIFLSCATKNSGPLKVDRNLSLREALSKTQDSGANTRLALIIFKGGNGNWIFLPWLAEARLSRDCFNNLRASGSNIVPGPRGLTGSVFILSPPGSPESSSRSYPSLSVTFFSQLPFSSWLS